MKLPSAYSLLLFVGLALFAGGVVVPTAEASCTVVVLGSCGAGCATGSVSVNCGTQDCGVVVLSNCVPATTSGTPGSCLVTTTDVVDQPSQCGGSCEVNVGNCDPGGASNDAPANCYINVGTCLGNGDCLVNVASVGATGDLCNGDCTVNILGACSSSGGMCTLNMGLCYGGCTVNLGTCYGRCTVNVDTCNASDTCLVHLFICRP